MFRPVADATQRFSNRVADYIRYRPSYPAAILATLESECDLSPSDRVADIGSGTGILSRLFLVNGNAVWGVEPNPEMREAGEQQLSNFDRFTSVNGGAEETGLPDASFEFITAGQAFHWFDQARARAEFDRLLVPGGWVVLLWNSRRSKGRPFIEAYETVLRKYSPDYARVNHHDAASEGHIAEFFAPQAYTLRTFINVQPVDREGLEGRFLSSSYAPARGTVEHAAASVDLTALFDTYAEAGKVAFEYETQLYFGRLKDA